MKAKYDRIGKEYNQTRKADAYLLERLIQHLCPKENDKFLDIGCGTGNYTIALNEIGFDLIGVEPSQEMLNKARASNSSMDWRIGKAEDIPLQDMAVDGILATLTTHHWENLENASCELNRVLKPEGRLVIFTSNPTQMGGYWLNHYFPKMLEASMNQMPTFEATRNALTKGGFEIVETEKYFVRQDLQDLFLYSGKHNPKIYLSQEFRNGISSFSDLANFEEIEKGLYELEKDIETGNVDKVIDKYKNFEGDYLFIIANKT